MRASRQASRPDIANDLPATHSTAGTRGNPAHMAIAASKAAGMIELHKIAIATFATCISDDAVGYGKDWLAIASLEIKTTVHAHIAQDRVPPATKS